MAGKYDSQLYALAASGLTASEAARQVGCQPSAVRRFTARTGVTFARRPPADLEQNVQAERGPAAMLTPHQRRDYHMLMKRGQYTAEEAVEIVLRPKVKIRFWRDGRGRARCGHDRAPMSSSLVGAGNSGAAAHGRPGISEGV